MDKAGLEFRDRLRRLRDLAASVFAFSGTSEICRNDIGEWQIRYTTRPRPTRGQNTRGPYRDTREQTHGPARPPPPGAD